MSDFHSLFPNFAGQCADLNRALTPVACVLFVIGMLSSTISGQRSPSAYLRTVGRTCSYVALLALLLTWGNEIAGAIDSLVKNTLKADPSAAHTQYQSALAVQKGADGAKSWWELLDGQALFEALLSAILAGIALLAGAIVFYAYLVQKFILYVGYGFAPLFIGFLAVRTLHSIGVSFLLGFAGVLCWPLGWGAASIITKGLIDFMADQSLLTLGGATGAAAYGLQNLIGVATLGLWLIFSTIAAPVIIQKAISTGTQIGQAFISGAVSAGGAGAIAGAGAAAALGSGGRFLNSVAGVVGGAAASAIGTVEASTSGSSHAPLGNLLGSLAHQRSRPTKPPTPPKPSDDDPTGDRAVRELLNQKRS